MMIIAIVFALSVLLFSNGWRTHASESSVRLREKDGLTPKMPLTTTTLPSTPKGDRHRLVMMGDQLPAKPKTAASRNKLKGVFPLIRNTGDSCAFDSLLQVLLTLELPTPRRVHALYDAFEDALGFDAASMPDLHLPRTFIPAYQRDHAVHFQNVSINGRQKKHKDGQTRQKRGESRMADADEILVTLWDEFLADAQSTGSQTTTLSDWLPRLQWKWRVKLGDRQEHSTETALVKPVYVDNFPSSGEADRLVTLSQAVAHEAEHNEELVDLDGTKQTKSWAYTQVPEWQVLHVIRPHPFRSSLPAEEETHPGVPKSGPKLHVSLRLAHPMFQSDLMAAVCFKRLPRSGVEHYYAIVREENVGAHRDQEPWFWVLYDGVLRHSLVLDPRKARLLINQHARLLFYHRSSQNDKDQVVDKGEGEEASFGEDGAEDEEAPLAFTVLRGLRDRLRRLVVDAERASQGITIDDYVLGDSDDEYYDA
jgi:hypothetical protein